MSLAKPAIMSGLMIPKAAMESTPRNWPITTPSIMEPTDEESESRMIMEPTDEESESRMKADSCM